MISIIDPYFLVGGSILLWMYFAVMAKGVFVKDHWPLVVSLVSHSCWALLISLQYFSVMQIKNLDVIQPFFLGFSFGLYAVSMVRFILISQINDKMERLFVKLALLYGLILMTISNLGNSDIAFLVYLGVYSLLTLWIHHTQQIKIVMYKHLIGLTAIFLCLILGYNQLINDRLIMFLQNSFLLVALLSQIKAMQTLLRR
jgi:hypothetical protein